MKPILLPKSYAHQRPALWNNLQGCSLALLAAELCQHQAGLKVVITENDEAAKLLHQEIQFFTGKKTFYTFFFPDWEVLPYDTFSPHEDIIATRLETLSQLQNCTQGLLFISITALMQQLCPTNYIMGQSWQLAVGDNIDLTKLGKKLAALAYRSVTEVISHGEFAIRGAILDVFPPGMEQPLRIDLFDNEIETIRLFDPESQRSTEKLESITLLPATEMPFDEAGIQHFKQAWRSQFDGNPLNCPLYQDTRNGFKSPGIEFYQALFFEQMADIFDYLPSNTTLIMLNELGQQSEAYWQEICNRYEERRHDLERPLLAPEQLWLRPAELFEKIKQHPTIKLNQTQSNKGLSFNCQAIVDIAINTKGKNPLQKLIDFKNKFYGKLVLCAESSGRKEILLSLLKDAQLQASIVTQWNEVIDSNEHFILTIAALEKSVLLTDHNIAIITEADLFEQRIRLNRKTKKTSEQDGQAIIKSIAELNIGDPIVHIEHGVGRFQGLTLLDVGNMQNEFILIEYQYGAKLYVPVTALNLLSRYSGGEIQNVPVNALGNDQWQKAKKKALSKVYDIAADLLHNEAKRLARQGDSYQIPELDYHAFCNAFPFEETPDQQNAIDATLNDLTKPLPMDRVICGDVGFGKTEVAMRAAFIATQNNFQVGILVPTTLLAEQHGQNFQDRFADWPIQIEVLSRFKTATEQKAILSKVLSGHVDILIGTHKLLQKDIKFKQLGLLIVDEEHRFGVKQKESLKHLKENINYLSMTATPIPRTLNMSLAKLRELSIIATPPAKRLAIKTFLYERKNHIILEAITRELHRGGQVFFMHNNVKTIGKVTEELQALLPTASIEFAHGQMRERQLEKIMIDFHHHRFNILVCTTIIENGIDIPTANTIIIDRADKLGLAQLHQLRGRVGRSHHQAYAYLLHPEKAALTSDAIKRLDAISSLGDLGAGFTLAVHDLEIRGAGEFLGEEQSGQIEAVGYSLYLELLNKAIKDIKEGKTPGTTIDLNAGAEIDLGISALITETYLPDVQSRLRLYHRINNCTDLSTLKDLQVEMIDRFGLFPDPLKTLFNVLELKLKLFPLGIQSIKASTSQATIIFKPESKLDPLVLIRLVQSKPNTYQLKGAEKLQIKLPKHEPVERADYLLKLMKPLVES